jgi:flagellar biogenesis protein FliO
MLARTTILLAIVIGLAIFTLRMAARHGIGVGRPSAGKLEVLDELALGPRQSVIAIRAGAKVLVASRSVNGLRPLGVLTRSDWEGRPFSEVLADMTPETDEEVDVFEDAT